MRAFAVLLCVLAVASVTAAASTGGSGPNVRGTLVRSAPVTTCFQGEPCDPPPQAAFVVFTRNGSATRARLGANGAFAVRLARGYYRVTVFPRESSTVSPAVIRVPGVGVIHPRFVQRPTR